MNGNIGNINNIEKIVTNNLNYLLFINFNTK